MPGAGDYDRWAAATPMWTGRLDMAVDITIMLKPSHRFECYRDPVGT